MEIEKLLKYLLFILIGVLGRVLPHPANFAPIGAMAIFGGAYFGKKESFILPIATMLISDYFIGFDSFFMRGVIYGSIILGIIIGKLIRNKVNVVNTTLSCLSSSLFFFITTNFAVWLQGNMYSKDLIGIINCYTMAIPFFRNSILGDLFYTGLFFGGYLLISLPGGLWNKRANLGNILRFLFIGK